MLPSISLVLGVEMVRDGGSLAAIFEGSNGAEYSLFFPLRHQLLPSGVFERLGYGQPIVIERRASIQIEVSWQHALILIHQVRPLIREPRQIKWLNAMEATAKAEGVLPDEIERFLPPVKFAPNH
jgi:hypothetical protein